MDGPERLFQVEGISCRDFLKISGVAIASLSLPLGCGSNRVQDEGWAQDVFRLEKPPPPTGEGMVSIVRSQDIRSSVNRAMEMAGGIEEIKHGDRVVINPNMTTAYAAATRVTTHPEVLRAVIKAVKERTEAKNITVAEAYSYMDLSTLEVAKK